MGMIDTTCFTFRNSSNHAERFVAPVLELKQQ
jgi:hypothetical protein